MATATTSFPNSIATTASSSVSWYVWAGVLGVSSSFIGGAWDVSWHRTIGRDSFLTPAHIFIYLCGVVAAVVCGYLILYTSFGPARHAKVQQLRAQSVSILGFQAPLGAFIAAWGGIAMLTSAPFDNWWHAAYGLDVKIISPPHTLLLLGVRAISLGVLFLILAAMNRAGDVSAATLAGNSFAGTADARRAADYKILQRMLLYMGGLVVAGQMFFLLETTWDIVLHRAMAYITMGMAVPVAFAVIWRASGNRWACTISAGIYTLLGIAEILILPLFHASPKLGPVYFPVTHFVPAKFPILIIVPAVVLDLLWQRVRTWKPWQIAAVSGVVFIAVLVAVEWPFASFLLSKASENRFFGTIYFDYNSRATGPDRMREFFNPDSGLPLLAGLTIASACATVSTWIGLKFGNWMRTVQR